MENTSTEHIKIAATHSLLAFHAYEQHKKAWQPDTEIHFDRDISIQGPLGIYTLNRHRPPDTVLKNWHFFPICTDIGYTQQITSFIGMVGHNKEENIITVSFRGSQCQHDWEHNYCDNPENIMNSLATIKAHGGYVEIINRIKGQLKEILSPLVSCSTAQQTLIITGHSLGGGLASVAIPIIIKDIIPAETKHVINLITFGAPYVASENYKEWLEKNNVRVLTFMRKTDYIPLIPYVRPNCKNNVPLSPIIWLHHFYHLLWPFVHDMQHYQKALLLLYPEDSIYNHSNYVTISLPTLKFAATTIILLGSSYRFML